MMRESKTANRTLLTLAAVERYVKERIGDAGEVGFAVHVAFAHDARVDGKGVEGEIHLGMRRRKKHSLDARAPRRARKHGEGDVMHKADALTVGLAWEPSG